VAVKSLGFRPAEFWETPPWQFHLLLNAESENGKRPGLTGAQRKRLLDMIDEAD
jgi:hypothetical protein